jgi:hypothetical protein
MNNQRGAFRIALSREIKLAVLLLAIAATVAVVVALLGTAAGIVAACLIPIAMIRPEWGLFILVVATFTNLLRVLIEHHDSPNLTVNFLTFCFGLSVLLRWAGGFGRPIDVTRPLLVLIAYGAVGAASLLYARHLGPVMR